MASALELFTTDIDQLVALPGVGVRISQAVDDPHVNAADIAALISQDPALAARVLRMANSAAFGLSRSVTSISRAIATIGMRQIRNLVLASSTIEAFERVPNELVSLENFWNHSLYCAIAARVLATHCRRQDPEVEFLGGLLHDIGRLVIFHKEPEKAREALWESIEGPDEYQLHKAELAVFGFDHAEVGAMILRHWDFPEVLVACVANHHAPRQEKQFPVEVAIVHIANSLAALAEIDSVSEEEAVATDLHAWELLALDKAIIPGVVGETRAQFVEARGILGR